MGTEQETEGLNDQIDADAIFREVYEASLKGTHPDYSKIDKKPEETPAEPEAQSEEQQETVEQEAPAAQTEAATTGTVPESPEELRARLATLEKEVNERAREAAEWKQKYKSDEGRVAAFQRRAQELERALREKPREQPKPATESKLKVEESEEWRTLQESDPVLARLLKNSVEEAVRQAEEKARLAAEAATKPLYEERESEYERRERDELYKLVPNLDEVKSSPLYAEWFESQDDGIKNLGYSARGVYRIMQLYDADMRARFAALEAAEQAAKPAETGNKPITAAPQVTAIQKERERKVQSQGVGGKVTATPNELSDEEIFARAYNANLAKRY